MDREKVIKAVESCFDDWLDRHSNFYPAQLDYVRQIKADALAMLKEQEKTPVVFSQDDGSVTTACGNCGWDLDKAYSRCPKCQKELDWNALQE